MSKLCIRQHALVKAGMAWWYRPYAPNDPTLAQLEAEARTAKRGLWADAQPVPPWQWRKGQRASSTAASASTDGPPSAGAVIGNKRSQVNNEPACTEYAKVPNKNRA